MPLEFWVGVAEGQYLQLDDVVVVETPLPDGRAVRLFGVVDVVRARHEGAKFDSDVFLIEDGVLPASVSQAAHVRVTRVEPEIFVPPRPGQEVRRAAGARPRPGPLLRRDGAAGAHRPEPRRRARLRQPRLPRRLAGRPRQHLGHLGGGHQDHLRHLPAPQPVQERRAGGRGRDHPRPHLQRQGRGPAVPRPAQPEAARRGPRRLRQAGPAGRALRAACSSWPPCGPATGAAARHRQPAGGRRVVLLDPARVRERPAAAVPVRRGGGRFQPARLRGRPHRGQAPGGRARRRQDHRPLDRRRRPPPRQLRRARGAPDRARTRSRAVPGRGVGLPRRPRHGGRLRAAAARGGPARRPPGARHATWASAKTIGSTGAAASSASSTSTPCTTGPSASWWARC